MLYLFPIISANFRLRSLEAFGTRGRGFYETAPAWPTAVWLAWPGSGARPGGLGLGLGGLGGMVWVV